MPTLAVASPTAAPAQCIVWGVNGHSLTQAPYAVPSYELQVRSLSELHSEWYRIDVPLEDDLSGRIRKPSETYNLTAFLELAATARRPVTVLPSVFPTTVPPGNMSWDELFAISRAEGVKWTKLYGGSMFDILELANEQDNVCIQNSDGVSKSGYNQTCWQSLLPRLTGFAAGVKAVMPDFRIIVDFSWVHFGFLDALVDAGLQWDILAPHWSAATISRLHWLAVTRSCCSSDARLLLSALSMSGTATWARSTAATRTSLTCCST